MPLTPELINRLLPSDMPRGDVGSLQPDIPGLAPRDEYAQRRLAWTRFLMRSLGDAVVDQRDVPFGGPLFPTEAWHIGIGFVPIMDANIVEGIETPFDLGVVRESMYVFGVTVFVPPYITTIDGSLVRAIQVDGLHVPLIIQVAEIVPMADSIFSGRTLLGTATCRAMSKPYKHLPGGERGVITARHVVHNVGTLALVDSLGHQTSLMPRRLGSLCVDAAFLEGGWPQPDRTLVRAKPTPANQIAIGDPALFTGASSGVVSGYVTHVSLSLHYSGFANPALVFSDKVGMPGDSGAMLQGPGSRPLSMLLGCVNVNSGATETYSLVLAQLEDHLKVEVYN